jgi:hypothetical protein
LLQQIDPVGVMRDITDLVCFFYKFSVPEKCILIQGVVHDSVLREVIRQDPYSLAELLLAKLWLLRGAQLFLMEVTNFILHRLHSGLGFLNHKV